LVERRLLISSLWYVYVSCFVLASVDGYDLKARCALNDLLNTVVCLLLGSNSERISSSDNDGDNESNIDSKSSSEAAPATARAPIVTAVLSLSVSLLFYGVVPYISKLYTGSVSGLVGAGGNVGSVIFGLSFRSLAHRKAFVMMAVVSWSHPFFLSLSVSRAKPRMRLVAN
jgi:nitrate/nitrite transporter NarK